MRTITRTRTQIHGMKNEGEFGRVIVLFLAFPLRARGAFDSWRTEYRTCPTELSLPATAGRDHGICRVIHAHTCPIPKWYPVTIGLCETVLPRQGKRGHTQIRLAV